MLERGIEHLQQLAKDLRKFKPNDHKDTVKKIRGERVKKGDLLAEIVKFFPREKVELLYNFATSMVKHKQMGRCYYSDELEHSGIRLFVEFDTYCNDELEFYVEGFIKIFTLTPYDQYGYLSFALLFDLFHLDLSLLGGKL